MAAQTDAANLQRFEGSKMELDVLTKTRAELESMMPVSQAAQDVA